MARVNSKKALISYENSIEKSREISMSKLSQGLTLNQMQLLAYAIFSTQRNGKTEFHKADFEKKFGIEKYQTIHAKQDVQKISVLQFSIEDLDNDYFEYWNVFSSIKYKTGLFTFRWNEEFVPHILELKDKLPTSTSDKEEIEKISSEESNSIANEALSALTMLGFSKTPAQKAINKILKQNEVHSVEELVKLCLKKL